MRWVALALVGLVGAGCVAVWRGLRARDWQVNLAEQAQLQAAMGAVVGGLTAALALRPVGPAGLLAGTVATAWIPARVCSWPPVATRLTRWCGGRRRARSVGWAVVAVVATWGPWLAAPGQRPLWLARGLIGATALVMIGYNAEQEDNACTEHNTAPTSTDD